jgi:DNA-nicking Smr family endonuclease
MKKTAFRAVFSFPGPGLLYSRQCYDHYMSRRRSDIDAKEKALFRQAVADVRPLDDDRAPLDKPRPTPHPRQSEADEAQVLQDMLSDEFDPIDEATGEELLFARPGIQKQVLRKLRQGRFALEGELDLHGLRVVEARQRLIQFLNQCRNRGARCVRIIHGKGLGSHQKQPVLKGKTNRWLQQRDEVLAFCSARQVDGGTGAVYVLLKRG